MKMVLIVIAALVLGFFSKVMYDRMLDSSESKTFDSETIDFFYESSEEMKLDNSELEKISELVNSSATHDEILLAANLVDKDYRYTDLSLVEKYFKAVTTDSNRDLPIEIDENTLMTKVSIEPYRGFYAYSLDALLSPEEIEEFIAANNAEEDIQKICDAVYFSKYQKSNNVKFHFVWYDLSEEIILVNNLDNEVCP